MTVLYYHFRWSGGINRGEKGGVEMDNDTVSEMQINGEKRKSVKMRERGRCERERVGCKGA